MVADQATAHHQGEPTTNIPAILLIYWCNCTYTTVCCVFVS